MFHSHLAISVHTLLMFSMVLIVVLFLCYIYQTAKDGLIDTQILLQLITRWMQSGITSRRVRYQPGQSCLLSTCWDTPSFSDFLMQQWLMGLAELTFPPHFSRCQPRVASQEWQEDWDICVQILIILSTRKLPYGIHTLASFKRLMNNLSRQTWNPSIREILNEKSIPNRNPYIPPFTFFSPNKSSPFGNVWSHREKIVHVQQCLSTG